MNAQVNPVQINQMQRNAVLGMAQQMVQPLPQIVTNPTTENVVTIQPRNVGLITGFIIEVTGNVTNGAVTVADRTGFGSSNILSNITFTDLNNVQRINTSGRHLALLNSAKQGFGFGGAYAPNLPMGYGNNVPPFAASAQLAIAGAGQVKHTYWLPLAYSADDLRGSIYAGIVSANMQIQMTINDDPFVGATDPLNAVYSGNNNGAWTGDVTINVYQVYYDQLPIANGGPVLPVLDLNTIYDIKQTNTPAGLTVNQDYPIAYSNFRAFLSTFVIYDNGGQFNGGSDINYFQLQAANSTNLFKMSPTIAALMARQTFMADPPLGCYYFDHRRKPLDTQTYGNLELVINPKTVNANANFVLGYEAFQQINQLSMAGSLPGGSN